MQTTRFEPSPAWQHALEAPGCPDHLLLLAKEGTRVAGWCRLFAPACPGTGEVELGIGSLPGFRGRGLGRDMVGRAINWAQAHAIHRITLQTHQDNVPARRLFEASGFTGTGQGTDGWLHMVRELRAGRIDDGG